MTVVNVVAGPLIGSVIGYFTNYIAVKMLFRPINPVKIGNRTLPFTPGMIPKRKSDLAKALGKAVGENLFTREDVKGLLQSEPIEQKVVNGIATQIEDILKQSVAGLITEYAGEDIYEEKKQMLEDMLCEKITEEILKMDLAKLIIEGGASAVKEKLQGSMLAMFISDDLIASMAEPIADQIKDYMAEHGDIVLWPSVDRQMTELMETPLAEEVPMLGLDLTGMRRKIRQVYETLIEQNIDGLLEDFDIAGTVSKKVDEMDVLELETLVLSVMKKELDGIVNLGALIGFLLGLLNILIAAL
ncbi:MAG: DUF445 family protein [Lachnospiraceae bacterium]|nr:DUF445 family protein [Lachnospiraceae bacterium]